MLILNVGAGPIRPPSPFINLDNLRTQLPPGSGARITLDAETNYCEHDLARSQMPFPDDHFDSVVCAHVIEHFPTPKAISIMEDCRRMLKPQGTLVVSVPDASYFRKVYPEDENANWPRLFDTTDPANPIPTFFRAALFYEAHDAVLCEDSLWAYFIRAGFLPEMVERIPNSATPLISSDDSFVAAVKILDRLKFSLVMKGVKS